MTIELSKEISFEGMLGGLNASAVSFWRGRALVVSDEVTEQGNILQVFETHNGGFQAVPEDFIRLDSPGSIAEEMDLEGIAVDGDVVFVMGSHSAKRKKVDKDKKYVKNRAALMSAPETQPARDILLRIELDSSGKTKSVEQSSLRSFLNEQEPFRSFGSTASKENGIDIEGLAAFNGDLYAGFRGPVLRGNYTPVLRFKFGSPIDEPELLFLDLGGRGIRDLAHAKGGMIILAGPVGDGPGSTSCAFWFGYITRWQSADSGRR